MKTNYYPRLVSGNGTSYDTNSINLLFENGMVASIFNSYATPLLENIVIIGTNGFIIIKDQKVEIFSPRDTFDENGFFSTPRIKQEIQFDFQSNGSDSLKKAMFYFLQNLKKSKKFDIDYFDRCVYTNKLILEIERDEN